MNEAIDPKRHIWKFQRVGGVNRVNIETGDDIKYLEFLDQKLWTALSCPVYGLEIDSKTLELIDIDKDERIRVPEILNATKWITSMIKNPDDLIKEPETLPLSAINDADPEGKKLLLSAKQILLNLDKKDSQTISIEDTSDTEKIFRKTKFNGDGVITEDSSDDLDLKLLIKNIIDTSESVADRSGNPGITQNSIEAFYKNCADYYEWSSKAEINPNAFFPYNDNTEESYYNYLSIKAKIDDYFIRCRLAKFDPKSTETLNFLQSSYETLLKRDLSESMEDISALPLSIIDSAGLLPLQDGINPAWMAAVKRFKLTVVAPLFGGQNAISESDWLHIQEKFDAYSKWISEKPNTNVEKLGLTRIKEILSNNKMNELTELILKDKALEIESNSIFLVDKLVRYYCHIYKLLKNFVSFHDFYQNSKQAVFQAGTLYIDQRSCDLCIKVSDMARQSFMAGQSGMFLIYCDCSLKSTNKKMTIVACLTNGDVDNLNVGRNAIFYDRSGRDWDAVITKIVDNPISIRQAFWSPYRKIAKLVGAQIEKITADKENQLQKNAASKIENVSSNIQDAPASSTDQVPVKHPPFDMAKFAGIFAAIGLALGALSSALVSVVTGFMKLTWWKMPLAIIGIILLISGPSMIIAWMKLRKRNLAPILDANGWAINARAIINIPFGAALTHIAALPKNSKRILNDPFKKKKNWGLWIVIILLILGISALITSIYMGWINIGEVMKNIDK